MQLSLSEWKSLCVGNMGMLSSELNKVQGIKFADVDQLNAWWAETMMPRLKAWATECAIVEKEAAKAQAEQPQVFEHRQYPPDEELPVVANGTTPPVRKGWPKGKKRTPKPINSAAALPPVTQ